MPKFQQNMLQSYVPIIQNYYKMTTLYKSGKNRHQQLLFPPSLDEYIDSENSIRAIDDYIKYLDFDKLGFQDTRKSNRADGQKAYSPKSLMRIYLYGYLNKIRSSRMLERECKRNIELMWLTSGLTPTYHTISDFRKNNPKALRKTFKHFVMLCKNLSLIGDGLKAVDGAFLRANASKNQLLMKKTLEKDLISIDKRIDAYLKTLDSSDKEIQPSNLAEKIPTNIEKLKARQQKIMDGLALLEELNKKQHNLTDPDASLMKKPAHNLMAYNTQITVDQKFKLIVATDVSSKGNDLEQLHKMSVQSKENLEVQELEIVGDTGYFSAKEIKKCVDDNIKVIIPEGNKNQGQKNKGKYTRDRYKYDPQSDCYVCPNNKILKKTISKLTKNEKLHYKYATTNSDCNGCPLREKCLSSKASYKVIYRWEHEAVIEQHRQKMTLDKSKEIIKARGSIVEHPFGTIKRMLGWDHYLVRGKEKVSGENALIMFTYNFKRVLNILGIDMFRKMIKVM